MEIVFWLGVLGVLYPYVGYPLALRVLAAVGRRDEVAPTTAVQWPTVSMIIPVHNEASRIARKVSNTAALRYPADHLQILFVSDGSADQTVELVRTHATPLMSVVELPVRRGKAIALNEGLRHSRHDIIVFSDASIELEPDALHHLVAPFRDPRVGCVSGEDRIAESGGEAWYGRFELSLRRLESRVGSIVGASGSFYAQRRSVCVPFVEGMAPDFLSVLRTVEQGYRAVSEQSAVGAMSSVKDPRQEFDRKVRTLIRGMTTLFAHARLLNPVAFGSFSFALWSHKIMRWMAPLFLAATLLSPLALLESRFYRAAFIIQGLFYLSAFAAFAGWTGLRRSVLGKVAVYFVTVHAAVVTAWFRYTRGMRQEIWTPSRR